MADRSPPDDHLEFELRHLRTCLARLPMLMAVFDQAGRHVWSFNFDALADEDHPSRRALHELELRALTTGQTCVEELELPVADGSRIFEITASPLRERGQLVGVSVVGIDLTQAEARTRMREEQLRLIAHDLRQPLNVIAIAAARLSAVVGGDAEAGPLSESINTSVQAMNRVLEDILETGEWETGAVLLRRERIEIGPFLRETLTASVPPEGLLRLRLELDGDCLIDGDRTKLGRALLNLVDNALKFSPPDQPVIVQVGHEAGVLRVAVVDRGPGLEPAIASQVFDKYQASSRSRARGGKGLGLYAARLIVEAHGGCCHVHSEPGRGATFAIELPCTGAGP